MEGALRTYKSPPFQTSMGAASWPHPSILSFSQGRYLALSPTFCLFRGLTGRFSSPKSPGNIKNGLSGHSASRRPDNIFFPAAGMHCSAIRNSIKGRLTMYLTIFPEGLGEAVLPAKPQRGELTGGNDCQLSEELRMGRKSQPTNCLEDIRRGRGYCKSLTIP